MCNKVAVVEHNGTIDTLSGTFILTTHWSTYPDLGTLKMSFEFDSLRTANNDVEFMYCSADYVEPHTQLHRECRGGSDKAVIADWKEKHFTYIFDRRTMVFYFEQ